MSELNLFTVSPSPHFYGKESVNKIMYKVILALIPALGVSLIYFGMGALIVSLVAIISCVLFEFVLTKYVLKAKPTLKDGSAILTGLLLAFNLPSNLPLWIIIIGAFVAIGIGKISFGGLGKNPFNPALVGRVFLLISFPVQMTSWPLAIESRWAYLDATTGATPLALLKEGIKNGQPVYELLQGLPDYSQMFLGNMGGSLGEISAIALIVGGLFLIWKKIITWHIPGSMLLTVVVFTGIMSLVNPDQYADPIFHILAGGMLLGAIFMATDMVTSPMTTRGQIIFGCGIGILTCVIRLFGAYPEGVSFAILIMNAFVPLIDKYIKPKRFGEVKKNG